MESSFTNGKKSLALGNTDKGQDALFDQMTQKKMCVKRRWIYENFDVNKIPNLKGILDKNMKEQASVFS
jgi:hypothetical protein